MVERRAFLRDTASAVTAADSHHELAAATGATCSKPMSSEPLVWPMVTKSRPGIPTFSGHTDTVLDVMGHIGKPASLVIFTEGNHLMVLSSDDILGVFPSWAKAQPEYADLDLSNIVLVTLPQFILVQMILTQQVAIGNLTLDVNRSSGFYPDIFMGYIEPLRQLRKLGVVDREARVFSRNRGVALLVRKGNPLGISGLSDALKPGVRIALPDTGDVRSKCLAVTDAALGKSATDALVTAEIANFAGRLGIMHRDLPEMVARDYADVAFTWYHLVSYWTRIFPDQFELVAVPGAERFFAEIASARVVDPLRQRAAKAFDEFFFSRAKEVYPLYDFARMNAQNFAAILALDP